MFLDQNCAKYRSDLEQKEGSGAGDGQGGTNTSKCQVTFIQYRGYYSAGGYHFSTKSIITRGNWVIIDIVNFLLADARKSSKLGDHDEQILRVYTDGNG
eukprot:10047650-Ditylum_brightwellii.AAC.1